MIETPTNPICPKCNNKGYTQLMYKAEAGEEVKSMMMFCTCDSGKQFRQITIDQRLEDLKAFAKEILPRLDKAHSQLHTPSEAGNEIRLLQREIRELLEKVEKAMNQETKP